MKRWFGVVESVTFISIAVLSSCSSHSPASDGVQAPVAPSTAPGATTTAPATTAVPSAAPPVPSLPVATATAPQPASSKLCGGIAGFRCDEKQYCAYSLDAKCGAGDMSGVCKPVPDMCTMEYAPVCGCDGKTYGSACVAARAGVSVAQGGACASATSSGIAEGKVCGTRGVPGTCADGLYCAFRAECGRADSGGTCTKKPVICSDLFSGVCGCDGKTYPNACHAARAGVSIAAQSACKTP